MFITSWLIKNNAGDILWSGQGKKTSLNRLSKENVCQEAGAKSVPNRQITRRDSWTDYMETLSQGNHTNFNLNFNLELAEAGIPTVVTTCSGALPKIPEEERIQLA